MQYFDAHTHLNSEQLFPHYQDAIDTFVQAWWSALVNIWADHKYNDNALSIAQWNTNQACNIYSVLGLHPCEIDAREQKFLVSEQEVQKEFQKLKALVLENKKDIVAIGECGIDLHYVHTPENLKLQKLLFQSQLDLARDLDFPVVIHSRDAFDETLDILKAYTDLHIYFHCRGYWPEEIQTLLASFPYLWIGFTGNITYPKAKAIRASLAQVPDNRILLETDAPYLAPQKVRGKTNHPAFIQYVYQFVAEQKGISVSDLASHVEKNFKTFYRIP